MNEPHPLAERGTDELEVSVRTSMAFGKAGIRTVGQLLSYSPAQLKASGFTQASIREVVDLLGAMGLSLSE